MDPVIVVTLLAVMGLAISLVFAVWRSVSQPMTGERFDKVIETLTEGSEISDADIELSASKKGSPKSWNAYWELQFEQAGRELRTPSSAGMFVLGLLGVSLAFGVLVAPGGVLGFFVPLLVLGLVMFWLMIERGKRRQAFEHQLPLLLSALRTRIKSGATIHTAITSVADDLPSPLGDEMRILKSEIDVGVSLQDALDNMSVRVESRLVQFLAASLKIGLNAGQDMAPQLSIIEEIVRQRARIAGRIKSAVAIARPTLIIVLAAIPGVFIYMGLTNEDYFSYYFGPGLMMTVIGVILYLMGAGVIKYLVDRVEKI